MTEAQARRIVAQRAAGVCERCGHARAGEWHHRKNRSQGGVWCPSNGLHLCHDCHAWVTDHPTDATAWGWSVRSWADPAEVAVDLFQWGPAFLLRDGGMELNTSPHTANLIDNPLRGSA